MTMTRAMTRTPTRRRMSRMTRRGTSMMTKKRRTQSEAASRDVVIQTLTD
jgi:hypothetical protein